MRLVEAVAIETLISISSAACVLRVLMQRSEKALRSTDHIGDASSSEVLEHCLVDKAHIIIITIQDHKAAMQILPEIRCIAPRTHVTVCSFCQRDTSDFADAGASIVNGDEEMGIRLGKEREEWLIELDDRVCGVQ